MATERRAWIRHECTRPIPRDMRVHDSEQAIENAWVLDLSVGGLGLILPHSLESGVRLAVELESRPEDDPVILHAVVVRADLQETKEWLIGCRFDTALTQEELERILG